MGLAFAYQKIEFPEREKRACWSYTGFHNFRERLAKEIGINLEEMEGFVELGETFRLWDSVDDLITPLINHSDCSGVLLPDQCGAICLRLLELVQYWPDNDYDKIHALRLVDMMEQCEKNEWTLVFK